ncbi:hypothetical protein ACFLXV_00065 [Chloroflexota bacterium]
MTYTTSPLSPPQPEVPPVEHMVAIEALVENYRLNNRLVVGSNPAGPTYFMHWE